MLKSSTNPEGAVFNMDWHINALTKEVAILDKLIYRNHNQHAKTKTFKNFKRVAKDITVVVSLNLVELGTKARKMLDINYRSSSEDVSSAVAISLRLRKAVQYLLHVLDNVVVAAKLVRSQLMIGLFAPLYSVLAAMSASLFVAVASCAVHLHTLYDSLHGSLLLLSTTNTSKLKPRQLESVQLSSLPAHDLDRLAKARAALLGTPLSQVASTATPKSASATGSSTSTSGAAETERRDTRPSSFSGVGLKESTYEEDTGEIVALLL